VRLTRKQLKMLVESLLLEEVYGAQAVVYHGTKADPRALVSALLRDEFIPGEGGGAMYGKGLYTVYDLKGTKTERGDYGDHVVKLKVNLYGYIIFDPDIALMVYKKSLTPKEQATEFGYSETVIEALDRVAPPRKREFTSTSALSVFKSLQYEVKGLVFTGENDGRVAVVYDPTTAVPMAWKRVTRDGYPVSEPWTPVDRATLLKPLDRPDVSAREGRPVQQSALRRSALGDFEARKWEDSPLKLLKRLERLPEDQRVVKGDLDLMGTPITSLPAGLKVGGSLNLSNTPVTSLSSGLQVGRSLYLSDTPITSLPAGLKVGESLNLSNTPITSLPAGLQVGRSLFLAYTPITSLSSGLQVGGDLDLTHTPITSLPAGLKVGGNLYLSDTPITSLPADLHVGGSLNLSGTRITSLPADLKAGWSLDLSNTPITSLPVGLKVGWSLDLRGTPITSLPAGLQVGGSLELRGARITSLPADLHVGGNLDLRGAPVTSLPAGLKVGGSLNLRGARIASLPTDLKVGDYIYNLDPKYWADVPEHLKLKLR